MRRKDRKITDKDEIVGIIEKCDVCRLGLADDGYPYVVPLNFGYQYDDKELVLYFHGAGHGRKIGIIGKSNRACFEMDCSRRLVAGESTCDYTMEYESVMGSGTTEIVSDESEKTRGLLLLMRHYAPGGEFSFSPDRLAAVTVFKLKATEFTGKRLSRQPLAAVY